MYICYKEKTALSHLPKRGRFLLLSFRQSDNTAKNTCFGIPHRDFSAKGCTIFFRSICTASFFLFTDDEIAVKGIGTSGIDTVSYLQPTDVIKKDPADIAGMTYHRAVGIDTVQRQ